ncbi:MAG: hypothetical protein ACI83B_002461 [Sediminicola sp.]|jgi:hypothetical protein
MKKVYLTTLSLLICLYIFAQEAKPFLFIGTFEKAKRGICSDYELVHEEIKDYAEYVLKRSKFLEEHKGKSPSTRFIGHDESVIAYQYEKKVAGWNCNSNVISTKIGKSIADCNKQLADQLEKSPKDFTTKPNIIFTWQGKGNDKSQYTKDFGGLNGTFTSGNTDTKSIIVAQLTNSTLDKLAYVYLKTDSGAETVEYINPGATFAKKYDTKNLEIKVIYLDSKKQKPSVDIINSIKDFVRERVTNENGELKISPILAGVGVRG